MRRAGFAIAGDRDHERYASAAAKRVLAAFARGQRVAIDFVRHQQRVEKTAWLREDDTDMGAVIDPRCQSLWFFARLGVVEEVEQRRVYFDVLRQTWTGWEVRWAHRGVIDLAECTGSSGASALTPDDGALSRAPLASVDPDQAETCCTWGRAGRVAVHCFAEAPLDVLACGPEQLIAALEALPQSDRSISLPTGGVHLDTERRTLDFWLAVDAPSALARARLRWPGWQVRCHRDRYARQEAASGVRFRMASEREQIARLRRRLGGGLEDAFSKLDQGAEITSDTLVVLSGPRAGERLPPKELGSFLTTPDGCWWLASRGETTIDGEAVMLPRPILHGEVLRAGAHEMEFRRAAAPRSLVAADLAASEWDALADALLGNAPNRLRNGFAELAARLAAGAAIDPLELDALVSAVDDALFETIDAILHHPALRALETCWRGLALLIERTDFDENIELWLLSCSLAELGRDLSRSPNPSESGFGRVICASPAPFSAIVADYEFSASAEDVALLSSCAAVAARAAAPLLAGASPAVFGLTSHRALGSIEKLALASPAVRALRAHEHAGDVVLALPRFLLRGPHGALLGSSIRYRERLPREGVDALPWGNAVYLLAAALAASFARYRSCRYLRGPIDDLARLSDWSEALPAVATECELTQEREHELSRQGFVPLAHRPGLPEPSFTWVNTFQAGALAEVGGFEAPRTRFDVHLGYRLYAARIAQSLVCVLRSSGLRGDDVAELETEANHWLGRYVADADVVSSAIRAHRPFRKASAAIVGGDVHVKLLLHVRHFGARIELERRLSRWSSHG